MCDLCEWGSVAPETGLTHFPDALHMLHNVCGEAAKWVNPVSGGAALPSRTGRTSNWRTPERNSLLRLDTVWNDDHVLLVHTQCANRAGSVIRGDSPGCGRPAAHADSIRRSPRDCWASGEPMMTLTVSTAPGSIRTPRSVAQPLTSRTRSTERSYS